MSRCLARRYEQVERKCNQQEHPTIECIHHKEVWRAISEYNVNTINQDINTLNYEYYTHHKRVGRKYKQLVKTPYKHRYRGNLSYKWLNRCSLEKWA
jgi:hypothetical protein